MIKDTLAAKLSICNMSPYISETDAKHTLSIPDRVIAHISPDATLPPIPISLILGPDVVLNGNISYTAWIEYFEHHRKDKSQAIQGQSNSPIFQISFGNVVLGGVFRCQLTVPIKFKGEPETVDYESISSIRGINPPKSELKARLGDIAAQVTAYHESSFLQFDQHGLPTFGKPHGFGVMQLDNPPATATQIWNWKSNVDAGKSLLLQKQKEARTFPRRERRRAFPKATDFTPEQLAFETYQRYNGGAYWQWDDDHQEWVVGPNEHADYAEKSMRIQRAVQAGTPPPGWD